MTSVHDSVGDLQLVDGLTWLRSQAWRFFDVARPMRMKLLGTFFMMCSLAPQSARLRISTAGAGLVRSGLDAAWSVVDCGAVRTGGRRPGAGPELNAQ